MTYRPIEYERYITENIKINIRLVNDDVGEIWRIKMLVAGHETKLETDDSLENAQRVANEMYKQYVKDKERLAVPGWEDDGSTGFKRKQGDFDMRVSKSVNEWTAWVGHSWNRAWSHRFPTVEQARAACIAYAAMVERFDQSILLSLEK